MRNFTHPNIVEIFDSYFLNEELWVVMEYMDCGALTGIISRMRYALFLFEVVWLTLCYVKTYALLLRSRLWIGHIFERALTAWVSQMLQTVFKVCLLFMLHYYFIRCCFEWCRVPSSYKDGPFCFFIGGKISACRWNRGLCFRPTYCEVTFFKIELRLLFHGNRFTKSMSDNWRSNCHKVTIVFFLLFAALILDNTEPAFWREFHGNSIIEGSPVLLWWEYGAPRWANPTSVPDYRSFLSHAVPRGPGYHTVFQLTHRLQLRRTLTLFAHKGSCWSLQAVITLIKCIRKWRFPDKGWQSVPRSGFSNSERFLSLCKLIRGCRTWNRFARSGS